MNISSVRAQLFEATDLPKVLCDLSFQYVDAIELFVENHGKLDGLSVDMQEAVKNQAATSEKLDLRGKNLHWEDLRSISTHFKQLRFLDLRDCPNLQSEQWKEAKPGIAKNLSGYRAVQQTFPYHASLVIRLHENTEIIMRHDDGNTGMQYIAYVYYLRSFLPLPPPSGVLDRIVGAFLRGRVVPSRTSSGSTSEFISRPDGFDPRLLESYVLPENAKTYQEYSELYNKS